MSGLLEGTLDDWLQGQMTDLFPQYGSPTFRPHVTLLGDIHGLEEDVISIADRTLGSIKVLLRL